MTCAGALDAVLRRAEAQGWAGPDPYDGLLAPMGRMVVPLGPAARMAFTQATLRWPAFRALVRPPASINPKGLGLFLGAVLAGRDSLGPERAASLGKELLHRIGALAVREERRAAWGYPFPWQSRFLWAPAGTPNAVATATVGWHLLDWADHARMPREEESRARELATGAALFLSERLNHSTAGSRGSAVSYTTGDSSRIINVSMLVGRLLGRVSRSPAGRSGSCVSPAEAARMGEQTTRLLQFALSAQREDGTWHYAEEARGAWVDSFHTGFVLEALLDLRAWGWSVPEKTLERGFAAYEGFFDPDGGARLFRQTGSPHDAHSAAQGILTYAARASGASEAVRPAARDRALQIAGFCLERLWLEGRGYFAYRIEKGRRNEQEYTRWVQAWMALGMSAALALGRVPEPAGV